MPKPSRNGLEAVANPDFSRICIEVENLYGVVAEELKSAAAILDAAEVLSALERAPEHHDTHPSHNIKTGGGYAHGRRLLDGTLPTVLSHVRYLVESALNDADVMREVAIEAMKGGVQ